LPTALNHNVDGTPELNARAAKYRDDLVFRAACAYEVLDPIKTPNLPD
jgi:hypothetical protein